MNQFTENICIEKVIAHSIPEGRGNNSDLVLSNSCFSLSDDAKRALKQRLCQTMDANSKSLLFEFTNTANDSAFELIRSSIIADESQFIEKSKELAEKLHRASKAYRIPACLMIIIQGSTGSGASAHKVLYILRAEPQNGFIKNVSGNVVSLELVNELFLSKSQKMFKAAAITIPGNSENVEHLDRTFFKCLVYDENFVSGNIKTSAKYFTKDFLGCEIPNDSKKKLTNFFEETKKFVNQPALLRENEVRDIIDALIVEIKSQTDIINYVDFANRHVPERVRELYKNKMREIIGDQASFRKERSYIEKTLNKRAVEFENGVIIKFLEDESGTSKIEFDENLSTPECTVLKVKSKMKKYA